MLTTRLFSYYPILIFDECARYLCNHWELKVFLSRPRELTVILDVCLSLSRGRSVLCFCIWYGRTTGDKHFFDDENDGAQTFFIRFDIQKFIVLDVFLPLRSFQKCIDTVYSSWCFVISAFFMEWRVWNAFFESMKMKGQGLFWRQKWRGRHFF